MIRQLSYAALRSSAFVREKICTARLCLVAPLLLATSITAQCRAADPAASISVPEGFEVRMFADDELAHDIFSLTTNSEGQVVVSGPGYVRILIDRDGDGQADAFSTYADSPATGAQGLYFDGHDLLCTGDGGLLRYRDRDGNGQADGPPEKLLSLKTGGEHFAHAVEQGPDGWWYVLLGNLAGINRDNVTLPSSPVTAPSAGVLMRIAPDFSGSEVIADGFRNPYDFAFQANGDAFTFDSDGERDVSLPWYRPTRVFHIMPGTHAGWVTSNWKHPDYYPDMPAVAADCGRGSPTGVVAYRHTQFPQRYHNALFALDWTFGRVFAVTLPADGSSSVARSVETFLTATGQFGFAPTDATVTPEGDLMISVGGRGTRGGVYRVHYIGTDGANTEEPAVGSITSDRLTQCLCSPQPLASWSRAVWTPMARSLGKRSFVAASLDTRRTEEQRVRAIEIVTQLFEGLDAPSIQTLVTDQSAVVRARAAWVLGRQRLGHADVESMERLLKDSDPRVVRYTLEALVRNVTCPQIATLFPPLLRQLDAEDQHVRRAAWKVLSRLTPQQQLLFAQHIGDASGRVRVAYALAITDRQAACNPPAFDLAWNVLCTTANPQLKLRAVRAAQKALGELGGQEGGQDALSPVYDGYANQGSAIDVDLDLRSLVAAFPSGDYHTDLELARLIAMLAPGSAELAEKLCGQLTKSSHPVDDLHYLITLSRLPVPYTRQLRDCVADALIQLESKLKSLGLPQERNWDLRVEEMYRQFTRNDPLLAGAVISHPQFGLPGHVVLARGVDAELRSAAAGRVAQFLEEHADVSWTTDVVYLLSQSNRPEHQALVRQQFDDLALRGSVIIALARRPVEADRLQFLAGLQSPDFAVLQASVEALEKLPASDDAETQFELLEAFRRLRADRQERVVRDRVVRLLRRNLGREFGYQFGLADETPPSEALTLWTSYLKERFPAVAEKRLKSSEQQQTQLLSQLASVDWSVGRPQNGQALFQKQACHSCHNTRTAVGPDLAGVGTRFSRDDLFAAIAYPNQDVSPRYASTLIETTRGTMLSGLIIYESVDGLTLLDSTNQTIRIEADEIESRHELSTSLMPAGLLDNLQPQDLADLYAYIESL